MKPVQLKPHQEEAVAKLANGKILYGGVGTGKSITSIAYFVSKVCGGTYGDFGSMRTPMDIYVITTAKKRDDLDWHEEAHKFGIHEDPDASVAGIKLTVDSWNNIDKYIGVKDAFFIFDEQRSVGSGAWAQSLIKIAKHNQWIMLTATPGDTWLDYITVFVANGWYKNRTEFKRRHVVYNYFGSFPKVDRYIETGTLVRLRNQILVHMPYERHTVRHCKDVMVPYDKNLMKEVTDKRWHVYEKRPLKNAGELFLVMRKVANSDPSRLTELKSLIQRHPKLIVFYNFDYELEMLRTFGIEIEQSFKKRADEASRSSSETGTDHARRSNGSGQTLSLVRPESTAAVQDVSSGSSQPITFAVGEWNGHKHERVPTTDSWLYLVQYTAGAEGWNCVETDAMVFYSQTYSWKHHWQAHGRIDRMNTPFTDLFYYYLVSDSLIDKAIKKALRAKRSFNERDLPLVA